jgi:hypothetical protein
MKNGKRPVIGVGVSKVGGKLARDCFKTPFWQPEAPEILTSLRF